MAKIYDDPNRWAELVVLIDEAQELRDELSPFRRDFVFPIIDQNQKLDRLTEICEKLSELVQPYQPRYLHSELIRSIFDSYRNHKT